MHAFSSVEERAEADRQLEAIRRTRGDGALWRQDKEPFLMALGMVCGTPLVEEETHAREQQGASRHERGEALPKGREPGEKAKVG
ncbi:MAG: hypothetical protein GEV13_13440 [Rhodospirillales bacterium]|nr:hypothetical protein [Rhodospirillales bacterium]